MTTTELRELLARVTAMRGLIRSEEKDLLALHNAAPALLEIVEAAADLIKADEQLRLTQMTYTTLSHGTPPAVREARMKYDDAFGGLRAALAKLGGGSENHCRR